MTRLSRYLILTSLAAVAVPVATVPAVAQQAQATPRAGARPVSERGWVGVSLNVETSQNRDGALSTSVTVLDVSQDSPAARAGIRPGDVILSINGAKSFPPDLRAGDTVRVTLQRAGRTREVSLRAAPRPIQTETPPVWTVTVRADSMVDRMYQAMDSLRVRLVRGQDGVTLVNVGGDPDRMPVPDRWEAFPLGEVHPPFGFYIFRGEAHDSLRQAMDDLNQQIRALRGQHASRMRALTDAVRGNGGVVDRSDPELHRIDLAMADAERRAAELRDAMARAERREALGSDGLILRRLAEADAPGAPRGAPAGFRPLDPYLLGQNRAAGAEVVDLRPELAEYFNVVGGVLVVDVPARTPAALAGIQPGDVLTEVGGAPVSSIQELRVGLSGGDAEIPLTVVRKGRRLQLLLKR